MRSEREKQKNRVSRLVLAASITFQLKKNTKKKLKSPALKNKY
jgi:hypothetical protein